MYMLCLPLKWGCSTGEHQRGAGEGGVDDSFYSGRRRKGLGMTRAEKGMGSVQ